MKNKLRTLLFLLSISTAAFSQRLDFFVTGGDFSMPKSTFSGQYEYDLYRKLDFSSNDSTYTHEYFRVDRQIETVFNVGLNFGVGARMNWRINEKWGISSGVELAMFKFTKTENYTFNTELLHKDTIYGYVPPFTNFNQCNYTNSISDLGTINSTPVYRVIELKIPFEARRRFFQKKLAATVGGFLACPVFSQEKHESFGIDHNIDENGMETCTYFKETIKDRAVAEVARMSVGLRLGFEQHLGRYWIGLNAEKRATNFFQKEPTTFLPSNIDSKPVSFNLRLGISL